MSVSYKPASHGLLSVLDGTARVRTENGFCSGAHFITRFFLSMHHAILKHNCASCINTMLKIMKQRTLTVCTLLFTLAALMSGCTSTSGGSGGYQLKQTRQDIDWAMVRYNNRAAFGFLTPQEKQRVSDAYKAYQTAFNAAAKQVNGNYNTPTPVNVKQLADQLTSILDSIP